MHDFAEDLAAILELLDSIFQELTLSNYSRRFTRQFLKLLIRHGRDDHRGEDRLQAANNMALDNLSSHVGDERFELDLTPVSTSYSSSFGSDMYLVD